EVLVVDARAESTFLRIRPPGAAVEVRPGAEAGVSGGLVHFVEAGLGEIRDEGSRRRRRGEGGGLHGGAGASGRTARARARIAVARAAGSVRRAAGAGGA